MCITTCEYIIIARFPYILYTDDDDDTPRDAHTAYSAGIVQHTVQAPVHAGIVQHAVNV